MISVIGYFGDRGACRAYRLLYPFSKIGMNCKDKFKMHLSGHIVEPHGQTLEPQIGAHDIVVLQRQYDGAVFQAVQKMKQKKAKLIYEIDDDLFSIPQWNPAHKELSANQVQRGIRAFLSIVDAVFVTTEDLAVVYRKHCKNVFVLPNSLDFDRFYPAPKNSKKKVVLWQGSGTHEKDLAILGDSLAMVHALPEAFVKVWGGHTIEGTYNVPPVPFEAFYPILSQMDAHIGLAPLVPCVFNNSKSNLKFLEYTAQGMVTVASNVGPYKTIQDRVTGMLVGDNRDWFDKINELLQDESLYNTILENAVDFVHENYNIQKNYPMWVDAFETVMETKQ
jgi:glycosyltransferase involved in cell wall biosynthesis